MVLFLLLLAHKSYRGCNLASLGRESKSDSDSTVCGWHKHFFPNILWDSFACSYWGILHLCANNHFNHSGRSLQWHCESSGGWLVHHKPPCSSIFFFFCFCYFVIFVYLHCNKHAEIWENNARNTGCPHCCLNPTNCSWLQWPLAQCSEVIEPVLPKIVELCATYCHTFLLS